mmetsp:Transcript_18128/g.54702  ORF Transcript_18128/g.54702 Transcript_18128/m.54702 type:complete len:80 (-) Transcript_18128:159-398(-)
MRAYTCGLLIFFLLGVLALVLVFSLLLVFSFIPSLLPCVGAASRLGPLAVCVPVRPCASLLPVPLFCVHVTSPRMLIYP